MDLLIAIIEFYNTYPHDDVFYSIASYLLEHFDEIEHQSLSELSDKTHVSVSTLHRFFKKLFEVSYSEVRNMQIGVTDSYEVEGRYCPDTACPSSERFLEYGKILTTKTQELIENVSQDEVKSAVDLMISSSQVIFAGYAIPFNLWRLQMSLVLLNVKASAFLNPESQIQQLEEADENSVLVVVRTISNSEAFNYDLLRKAKEKNMKTVLIANTLSSSVMDLVDYPFVFKGTGTEIDSHLIHTILSLFGIVCNEEIEKRNLQKIRMKSGFHPVR